MPDSDSSPSTPAFQLGDRVTIRHPGGGLNGRIVELRGALGPGGAQIYRVILRRRPPHYVEVRADQLELRPVVQKPI